MKVFVTGATGFVGSRVVRELVRDRKDVVVLGLCRTPEAAESLKAIGVEPVIGDVQDPAGLEKIAREVDVVLHLAFIHDFSQMEKSIAIDLEVAKAFKRAIEGTNKRVIMTGGTLLQGATEPGKTADDNNSVPSTRHRGQIENYALNNNMSIIRLPPFVYGPNDKGFAHLQIQFAKKNNAAVYLGDGNHQSTTVHVEDAAHLYVLAMDHAIPGHAYHAANQFFTYKELAKAVGKIAGVETKEVPVSEGPNYFPGMFTWVFSTNHQASASHSEKELGWKPTNKPSLFDYLADGTYKA